METFIGRYRNVTILAALLFGQVLGLAVQVKRPTQNRSTRLIRVWAVSAVTPLEKGIVGLQDGIGNLWHNYFYLRGVRRENRDLKKKIQDLELERARLSEDAEQAHRLQLLLGFKEQYISKTVAAQVIGSSGSQQSRSVYIDKGSEDGIKQDMAVITADGVVGKVLRAFDSTSQVLLIDDQTSGVGAILEKSRLQGVLRGTPAGQVVLEKVMSDETVQPGEHVLTSGGDQIFPKGLPVGTVTKVSTGADLFLNIRVKPAADLNRLDEVLVITQEVDREPSLADSGSMRASDILAARLPSVPDKPAVPPNQPSTAAKPGTTAATEAANLKPGTASASAHPVLPETHSAESTVKAVNAPLASKIAAKAAAQTSATNSPLGQKPAAATTKPAAKRVTPVSGQPAAPAVKKIPTQLSPASTAPAAANPAPSDQSPTPPPPPQDQPQ
jgi:rod shape-determining protein MreC